MEVWSEKLRTQSPYFGPWSIAPPGVQKWGPLFKEHNGYKCLSNGKIDLQKWRPWSIKGLELKKLGTVIGKAPRVPKLGSLLKEMSV